MLVGISGPSGSGKNFFIGLLSNYLDDFVVLSTDNYFLDTKGDSNFNFDEPNAINWNLIKKNVKRIIGGDCIYEPIYSYSNYTVVGFEKKCPARLILLEGIFSLYDDELSSMMDYKIFIYSPLEICLRRRINRDVYERNRDIEESLRWLKNVKEGALKYVLPTASNADIFILNFPDKEGINRMKKVIDFLLEKVRES